LKTIKSRKAFTFVLVAAVLVCLLIPAQSYLTAFADEKRSNGSTIGGIDVSGLKDQEIKKVLENAIDEWASEPIVIRGGGEELSIDPQEIIFDIDRAIDEYRDSTDKPFYLFWKSEEVVHIPIHISDSESIKEQISYITIWDTEDTYKRVLAQASYLESHEIEAVVTDTTQLENERIALSIEKIPANTKGVQALAEELNEYILEPNEAFSLLTVLENLTDSANTEGLNFVGSMIYNTVLQANIEIMERHAQKELPGYLQPGLNVSVDAFSEKDLQFINVSKHPYLLKMSVEGENLKVELYSSVKDVTVRVSVQQQTIAPRIINRFSKDLPMGSSRLIQEGKQGLRVTVTRTMTDSNGEEKTEEISRDYYAPTNRIVLKSAIQPKESAEEETGPNSGNVDNLDLDGNGLPDFEQNNNKTDGNSNQDKDKNKDELPPGSYYDKGGNLVTS